MPVNGLIYSLTYFLFDIILFSLQNVRLSFCLTVLGLIIISFFWGGMGGRMSKLYFIDPNSFFSEQYYYLVICCPFYKLYTIFLVHSGNEYI